ncbi:MAG: TATA-box-binding protein [Methanosarcinales archaeon]
MAMIELKIENVVASTKISEGFDLKQLESELSNVRKSKKRFPGLIYRIEEPKAAVLIFASGKVVCTGVQSVEDVETVLNTMKNDIKKIGIEVKENTEIKVHNIVASVDMGTELNLNKIASGLGLENVEYEPEQFPGVICRTEDPKSVILIFGSGKLVVTGSPSVETCKKSVENIKQQLEGLGLL